MLYQVQVKASYVSQHVGTQSAGCCCARRQGVPPEPSRRTCFPTCLTALPVVNAAAEGAKHAAAELSRESVAMLCQAVVVILRRTYLLLYTCCSVLHGRV